MRPTWTSPSRVDGPAWPCTGRGLPGRRVTATPVRSYRTISPLPVRGSRVAAPSAVSFLWHFPAGFPGWALPTALPCGVRTFLEGFSLPPRSARPAPRWYAAADLGARIRPDMVAAMRNAVVTGAGGGLGRAIALELARRGFAVRVTDVDVERAAGVAAEIGPGATSSPLDVRDEAACRALAGEVAAAGGLDLWVNNAGILVTGNSWEQDEPTRRAMLAINAAGTINGTVAALEVMLPSGRGHIINIVSLAGIVAAPGEVTYSASKHAAMAFTLGTLFDLRRAGHRGIELSAVCPDGIWTPMLEDKLEDPDAAGSFSGQLLTPEKVATEVGKLLDRPRPVLTIPRWRGALIRIFDAFPSLTIRLLPALFRDAQRRQRRYKQKIESGRWP